MIPKGWVCLKEVGMDYEADIIIGLLQDNHISTVKHYPEAGEYLKLAYGMASSVRIYVAPEDYAQGKALLAESEAKRASNELVDGDYLSDDQGQIAGEGRTEADSTTEPDGWIKEEALAGSQAKRTGRFSLIAFLLIVILLIWVYWQGSAFFSR